MLLMFKRYSCIQEKENAAEESRNYAKNRRTEKQSNFYYSKHFNNVPDSSDSCIYLVLLLSKEGTIAFGVLILSGITDILVQRCSNNYELYG